MFKNFTLQKQVFCSDFIQSLFGFVQHQENASHGSEHKLTMKYNEMDKIIQK